MSPSSHPTARRQLRNQKRLSGDQGKRFPRLAAIGCLLLWALASGAHWDALQMLAWARMAHEASAERSFGEALADAIATEERCALCIVVHQAKQQAEEQEPPLPVADKLLLVWIRPAACIVPAPVARPLTIGEETVRIEPEEAPPVPPPRTA